MAKTRQSKGATLEVAGRDDLCCSSLKEAPLDEDEATELGMFGAWLIPFGSVFCLWWRHKMKSARVT